MQVQKKKLVDKLVEECSESIYKNEIISVALNNYGSVCNSCEIYIVLFVVAFIIIISISSAFVDFDLYLKKSTTGVININAGTESYSLII